VLSVCLSSPVYRQLRSIMGAAASKGLNDALHGASKEELEKAAKDLSPESLQKLLDGLKKDETVSCYCGECQVIVKGDPKMCVFCHCDDCRKWGGSIAQAAKLYPADAVTVVGKTFSKVAGERRQACAACGGKVIDDMSKTMGMKMVPAGMFNSEFKPNFQIMLKHQIYPVKDGLDHFKDTPKDFGGSDEKVNEAFAPDAIGTEETVSCYCGECKVTVKGDPAMQVICHCDDCRKWGGGVAQAAKLYPPDNVTATGEMVSKVEGKRRMSCAKCGGVVLDDMSETMKMKMVPAGLFNSPFKPTMHLMYKMKVMPIKDGLPKFKELPKDFGGSDEKMEE